MKVKLVSGLFLILFSISCANSSTSHNEIVTINSASTPYPTYTNYPTYSPIPITVQINYSWVPQEDCITEKICIKYEYPSTWFNFGFTYYDNLSYNRANKIIGYKFYFGVLDTKYNPDEDLVEYLSRHHKLIEDKVELILLEKTIINDINSAIQIVEKDGEELQSTYFQKDNALWYLTTNIGPKSEKWYLDIYSHVTNSMIILGGVLS